jgi:hypothetical protein
LGLAPVREARIYDRREEMKKWEKMDGSDRKRREEMRTEKRPQWT